MMKIGEMLLDANLITKEQLETALKCRKPLVVESDTI